MENLTMNEIIKRLERLINDCRSDICSDWIDENERRALEFDITMLIDANARLNHLMESKSRVFDNIPVGELERNFQKVQDFHYKNEWHKLLYDSEKRIMKIDDDGDEYHFVTANKDDKINPYFGSCDFVDKENPILYVYDDENRKIITVIKDGVNYIATSESTGILREEKDLFGAVLRVINATV